jgi:uncharacterized SAM-binding protein YcdF (DUF218 family)
MRHARVTSSSAPSRHGQRWTLAGLVFTLVLAALLVFFYVGRWLVVEDDLEKADAIAVLSGRVPARALEATRLYHRGFAPEIWLTRPTEPRASLEPMGIPYVGEEYYSQRVLLHEGVPVEAIRVLDPPILNTSDEVNAIASALERDKASTIIIVTSRVHTRRTRTLWRKLASKRGRAIVRAAEGDSFDPSHWWRNTNDALEVVREVLGLLNAWMNFPLHASR